MEEEARQILKLALAGESAGRRNLADSIRKRFASLGGVELPGMPRGPIRRPPNRLECLCWQSVVAMNRDRDEARSARLSQIVVTSAGTAATVLRASEISEAWKLSFWDSLIVAAAEGQDAAQLLTEDLGHGQVIAGVRIVDPFL